MRREEELIKLAIYVSPYKKYYFNENKIEVNGTVYTLKSIDDLVNALGIAAIDFDNVTFTLEERVEKLEEETKEQKDYILYLRNQLYDNGLDPDGY